MSAVTTGRQIGGTLAAILAINVVFSLAVVALLDPWTAALWTHLGVRSTLGRYALSGFLVLLVLCWVQIVYTRQELLAEAAAETVDESMYPDLHARVTRLSAGFDMAPPAVAIASSEVPNSLAIGDLRSGTIVVSDGLLESLEPAELDAVLAHELAHLKNRDALVLTLASFLPALVADERVVFGKRLPAWTRPYVYTLAIMGGYVLASTFIDAPLLSVSGFGQFIVAGAITIVLGGVVLGVLAAPVVFLSRRLSRAREFVADRASAHVTGDPAALASALERLDGMATVPSEDARIAGDTVPSRLPRYRGLDGMCFLPHGFEWRSQVSAEDDDAFHVETRSHPPTEERIVQLQKLAAELETTVS